jgi:hypothetical protein
VEWLEVKWAIFHSLNHIRMRKICTKATKGTKVTYSGSKKYPYTSLLLLYFLCHLKTVQDIELWLSPLCRGHHVVYMWIPWAFYFFTFYTKKDVWVWIGIKLTSTHPNIHPHLYQHPPTATFTPSHTQPAPQLVTWTWFLQLMYWYFVRNQNLLGDFCLYIWKILVWSFFVKSHEKINTRNFLSV